jgi:transcriptional regulator with XRE-family HTH domain
MTPANPESKPFRSSLARALRMRRAEKDLTQDAVALLAGVDRKNVALIEAEKGNPTLDTIDRLAGALDLEVEIRGAA